MQIFKLLEEKGVATVEDLNETAATHDYAFSFLQDIPLGDPERLEATCSPPPTSLHAPQSPVRHQQDASDLRRPVHR